MGTWVEKMEANAAKRLVIPPDHTAGQELARFRNFLKIETQRLKMLHRAGESGLEVCRGRATLVDILLCAMWSAAKRCLSAQAQQEFPPLALVALGGYGRGELSPFSDLDIMFLHAGQVVAYHTKPLPHLQKLMDGVLMPLWDLGFKVGHSVRTIADCVENANSASRPKSMETKTSLLEARLIVGDRVLFDKFQKAVIAKCVEGHEAEYLAARIADQQARRDKFGNSPTMLEPNLKNGCGGLRDYQNLQWMAFFKYRTRTLADLEQRQLLDAAERKQLERAYDFLLRVRTELHCQANRAQEVLQRSLQPAVALGLGYPERSISHRLERFMRDLYFHSRNLYLITRTLEERLALTPQTGALASLGLLIRGRFQPPKEQPLDGFKILGGQIHYGSTRVFRDQPRRLMRVFLYAQQRGLRLHPDLAQLIRRELLLVDRAFLRDPHVRDSFLEVLSQRGNVARVLRGMHETGLLGKYLPEFGKLTCRVQHEFYHLYSADEHTLQCLEQLDRIWEAQELPYKNYAEYFKAVERPFVLYLALLLHDAAKPLNPRDHSEAGGQLSLRVARRLGLDGATSHTLRLLVEQHLTMAMISQRRDLDDRGVIRALAAQVQTLENLRMLTLHTVVDSLGTSDKLWNGFKDYLLVELFSKTARALEGGTEFIRAEEQQRQLLAQAVESVLPKTVKHDELQAHFEKLPPRYFLIHSVKEITTDLTLAHRFMQLQVDEAPKALEPVVDWRNEPDRGYTTAKICTWDRAGLFSQITGSFSAAGLNILSAQIFTRTDGIVLDTFFVVDGRGGNLVKGEDRAKFEHLLVPALTTGEVDLSALIAKQRVSRPLYQGWEGERLLTTVRLDNEASETRTVIEIETEDRLGLLYDISRAMAELRLDISLAKISTEKGAAIDVFYVSEVGGQKVVSPERQQRIKTALRAAIDGPAR